MHLICRKWGQTALTFLVLIFCGAAAIASAETRVTTVNNSATYTAKIFAPKQMITELQSAQAVTLVITDDKLTQPITLAALIFDLDGQFVNYQVYDIPPDQESKWVLFPKAKDKEIRNIGEFKISGPFEDFILIVNGTETIVRIKIANGHDYGDLAPNESLMIPSQEARMIMFLPGTTSSKKGLNTKAERNTGNLSVLRIYSAAEPRISR